MSHQYAKDLLRQLINEEWHTFATRGARLSEVAESLSDSALISCIDVAGIIPEEFPHDSTEEKLYAKYCDALLAESLRRLGFDAWATVERSDAADVQAEAPTYTLVGDAKAFRLSRTAKNQKDFKVESLHQWKKGADYAILVAPLYQYPSSESQIYRQASTYGVTLLSFSHVGFLLRYSATNDLERLRDLWEAPSRIEPSKSAAQYWSEIDASLLRVAGNADTDWSAACEAEKALIRTVGADEIATWEEERSRIENLDLQSARSELLKASRVDERIELIRRTLSGL